MGGHEGNLQAPGLTGREVQGQRLQDPLDLGRPLGGLTAHGLVEEHSVRKPHALFPPVAQDDLGPIAPTIAEILGKPQALQVNRGELGRDLPDPQGRQVDAEEHAAAAEGVLGLMRPHQAPGPLQTSREVLCAGILAHEEPIHPQAPQEARFQEGPESARRRGHVVGSGPDRLVIQGQGVAHRTRA